MFSDFIQVIYHIRKHPTKNEYFPKHILFTIIYLLREQILNHRNMNNFIQAKEHDMNMHVKIQCMNMHGFL
jgi:hypothetical protein